MITLKTCQICQKILFKESLICEKCRVPCLSCDLIFRNELDLPIFSLFHYVDPLEKLIPLGKIKKGQEALQAFAFLLAQKISWECLAPVQGVIPMPAKIYGEEDHAYVIAETIAHYFKVPLALEFLERMDNSSQKLKTRQARYDVKMNLRRDFKDYGSSGSGLWLLVDDVVTTGSTLLSAWALLGKPRAAGLTLASTPLRTWV